MPRILVGISGWNYEGWKGRFYPEELARRRWLGYASSVFPSIEVNATFYREMRESTYLKWRDATPEGFVWAVKAHRYITHVKRLAEAAEPVSRFIAAVDALGDKLGPLLFQLPPSLAFDRTRVEAFAACLPPGRRCVIEARHASWMTDDALEELRKRGLGWCISDSAGRFPSRVALTSDFAYVRLHGPTELYSSSYPDAALRRWADIISDLGVDAYVYFDNDYLAYAPMNAIKLMELLPSCSVTKL